LPPRSVKKRRVKRGEKRLKANAEAKTKVKSLHPLRQRQRIKAGPRHFSQVCRLPSSRVNYSFNVVVSVAAVAVVA